MCKKLLCAVILVLAVVSASFAAVSEDASAEAAAKDPEKVLARVDSYEIKEKDIDALLEAAGPQVAMMYGNEEGRKMVLEDLVNSRLLALSARKQSLDQTPEFKELVDGFAIQALARAAIDRITQGITVTDEECKKFYDEGPENFTTPEQVRARHILLADDVTSADKIALVQDELKKGTAFDALATEHSIDPSPQQGGGDLGFFGRGQMVPEFEEAAFALKEPGEISAPVKSSFGWHIIKLEEKKPASVTPYEEVKPQIEEYLSGEKIAAKYQEAVEALKKEYKVELLP